MVSPVVAADGITYDLQNIKRWLDDGNTKSPVTGAELEHTHLNVNQMCKSQIQEWRAGPGAELMQRG